MSEIPFIIGIGGGTGAGKTTIANDLFERFKDQASLIPIDNYYLDQSDLSPEERTKINYDHPDAIEWERLIEDLSAIRAGQSITMPQYDFGKHVRKSSSIHMEASSLVIVEGIFALYHEEILGKLHIPVYVQTDADVRVLRRLQRDVANRGREIEDVVSQYLSTVKPMHEKFVEPTKQNADVIIPKGKNQAVIDLLSNTITNRLEQKSPSVGH